MANTIKIRRSAVSGKTPTTDQLSLGELAVNTNDGRLYLRKESDGVTRIVDVGADGRSPFGPILQNQQVISQDECIHTSYNGLSVGPIEIAAGTIVEIPSNSVWLILQ